MKPLVATILLCIGLSLAGCGTSRTDRALSGGALGAAGGAAIGAMTGSPGTGALLGGAAGAAAGGFTSSDQVDLGRPAWR
jgi:osmotically inducible lipoprotein OsmB